MDKFEEQVEKPRKRIKLGKIFSQQNLILAAVVLTILYILRGIYKSGQAEAYSSEGTHAVTNLKDQEDILDKLRATIHDNHPITYAKVLTTSDSTLGPSHGSPAVAPIQPVSGLQNRRALSERSLIDAQLNRRTDSTSAGYIPVEVIRIGDSLILENKGHQLYTALYQVDNIFEKRGLRGYYYFYANDSMANSAFNPYLWPVAPSEAFTSKSKLQSCIYPNNPGSQFQTQLIQLQSNMSANVYTTSIPPHLQNRMVELIHNILDYKLDWPNRQANSVGNESFAVLILTFSDADATALPVALGPDAATVLAMQTEAITKFCRHHAFEADAKIIQIPDTENAIVQPIDMEAMPAEKDYKCQVLRIKNLYRNTDRVGFLAYWSSTRWFWSYPSYSAHSSKYHSGEIFKQKKTILEEMAKAGERHHVPNFPFLNQQYNVYYAGWPSRLSHRELHRVLWEMATGHFSSFARSSFKYQDVKDFVIFVIPK